MGYALIQFAAFLAVVTTAWTEPDKSEQILIEPLASEATPARESPPMQSNIPKEILEPVLNKAAELAKISREQLVIVRAEPAVWNDGSLGCPEPGMQYTQALVNGYWIVIKAAGQTYDFRMGRGGNFQLCPEGRGRPPFQQRDAS